MLVALRLILLAMVLIAAAFFAAGIEKMGFRAWLRGGFNQPGCKWFGWYFPMGFKVLGPALYLLGMLVCAGLLSCYSMSSRVFNDSFC